MAEEKKTEQTAEAGGEGQKGTAKKAPAAVKREGTKPSWTIERCQRAASRFPDPTAWETGAPSSFKAATARGWMAQCTAHMKGATAITAAKKKTAAPKTHKKSA